MDLLSNAPGQTISEICRTSEYVGPVPTSYAAVRLAIRKRSVHSANLIWPYLRYVAGQRCQVLINWQIRTAFASTLYGKRSHQFWFIYFFVFNYGARTEQTGRWTAGITTLYIYYEIVHKVHTNEQIIMMIIIIKEKRKKKRKKENTGNCATNNTTPIRQQTDVLGLLASVMAQHT